MRGDIVLRSENNLQSTQSTFYIVPGGETSGGGVARYPLQVGTAADNVISGTVNKVVIHRCAKASELVLQDLNGTYYALWVSVNGNLRIENLGASYLTLHGVDTTAGIVVGSQT